MFPSSWFTATNSSTKLMHVNVTATCVELFVPATKTSGAVCWPTLLLFHKRETFGEKRKTYVELKTMKPDVTFQNSCRDKVPNPDIAVVCKTISKLNERILQKNIFCKFNFSSDQNPNYRHDNIYSAILFYRHDEHVVLEACDKVINKHDDQLHGRRKGKAGGPRTPWILKIFAKKVIFLVSRGKKQILPLLPPLEKFWKNTLMACPWKKSFRRPWPVVLKNWKNGKWYKWTRTV